MDNQLDNLKRQWQNINATPSEFQNITNGNYRMRSHRKQLKRYYTTIAILSGAFIVFAPFNFCALGIPTWICIVTALFFAVMTVLCIITLTAINDIDFGSMSTLNILHRIEHVMKLRIIHKIIGITLVIPLLIILFHSFQIIHQAMLIGGICGAIIGAIVGSLIDLKAHRHLRAIRQELLEAYS